MPISKKPITITEYGILTCEKEAEGCAVLPAAAFNALERFIYTKDGKHGENVLNVLSLGMRSGLGKIISAKNYVGVITVKDGTVIEILPKIVNRNGRLDEDAIIQTRQIFLKMLKELKSPRLKDLNLSKLNTERMNILEVFIMMFINEATALMKQGLKSSYSELQENERYFRGKLVVSEDIRQNIANKSRFFIKYDEFNPDRPENRLIKSTLGLLRRLSSNSNNQKDLYRLFLLFEDVDFSANVTSDFIKCSRDRSMSYYKKTLDWCKIFLCGESFSAFTGNNEAIAILFPMETVFESYVASKIRKAVKTDVEVWIQDKHLSLFDCPKSAFPLHPDIVMKKDTTIVVMDTKWKLLDSSSRAGGVLQSDMYQMYAYGRRYQADTVRLIYPKPNSISDIPRLYITVDNDGADAVKIEIEFIDLLSPDRDIERLASISL